MNKKDLRQQLRQVLASFPASELHELSVRACTRLAETREYHRSEIIMVFLSLPNEADTTPLVLQAWRDRKRVLAPRVSWEQRRMLPVEVRSLSDDVSESPLGIREPGPGLPIPVSEIDMIVVPGIGFDRQGNRIGRGRGFYDRFLSHPDWRGIACGFALEVQIVDHVPHNELDRPVDMLVTDGSVTRFRHHRDA